jgi:hypothetical protein
MTPAGTGATSNQAHGPNDAAVRPRADEGVEGNSRITAANGLLLTVLFAAEGLTILRIRQLITLHIFVGMLLLTPIALKIATTTYRFGRYYLHGTAYVRRGPPTLWLRILGPPLVAATVAVMATGVALLPRRPGDAGILLTLHKGSFILWVGLMTLHFLGHIAESLRLSARDWRSKSGSATPGRTLRTMAIVLALLAGVAIASAFTPGNNWSGQTAPHQRGSEPPAELPAP